MLGPEEVQRVLAASEVGSRGAWPSVPARQSIYLGKVWVITQGLGSPSSLFPTVPVTPEWGEDEILGSQVRLQESSSCPSFLNPGGAPTPASQPPVQEKRLISSS